MDPSFQQPTLHPEIYTHRRGEGKKTMLLLRCWQKVMNNVDKRIVIDVECVFRVVVKRIYDTRRLQCSSRLKDDNANSLMKLILRKGGPVFGGIFQAPQATS